VTEPEPPKPSGLPYGVQVAFGFFLPLGTLALLFLGLAVTGGMAGQWSGLGVVIAGAVSLLGFLGGLALASRRGWKGVVLGLVLFGALFLLLVGACFFLVARGSMGHMQ
jgi:hypothetical protein